jgi:hypothetical protein
MAARPTPRARMRTSEDDVEVMVEAERTANGKAEAKVEWLESDIGREMYVENIPVYAAD